MLQLSRILNPAAAQALSAFCRKQRVIRESACRGATRGRAPNTKTCAVSTGAYCVTARGISKQDAADVLDDKPVKCAGRGEAILVSALA